MGVGKADLGLLLGKIQQHALETPRTSLWHKAGIPTGKMPCVKAKATSTGSPAHRHSPAHWVMWSSSARAGAREGAGLMGGPLLPPFSWNHTISVPQLTFLS